MLGKPNIDRYNISLQSGQKKKDLKTELDNLSSKIKFLEASPQENQDEIQDLKNQQRDILIQLNTMDTKGATQFDFSQAKLAEAGVTAIMNGGKEDVLSLSAEERDKTIERNHSIFQDDIKQIIEESNLVYYKINNFILSNKGNANEAYNSVKTLEQHLSTFDGLPTKEEINKLGLNMEPQHKAFCILFILDFFYMQLLSWNYQEIMMKYVQQ
jgi:hypothetical protein